MRSVLMMAVSTVCVPFTFADEKIENPLPKEKWETDYLEKEWGLKVKSVSYRGERKGQGQRFELLIEFYKDAPDLTKLAQTLPPGGGFAGNPPFVFYCFDEDKVVIMKSSTFSLTAGEITGKKGDAFRLGISFLGPIDKISKIEVRATLAKK